VKSPGETLSALLAHCRSSDWSGYDPYDALSSRLFNKLTFLDSRLPRLALTQLLKRSPVNIRPLLLVPKMQNPKAIALFLSVLVKCARLGILDEYEHIGKMAKLLALMRSDGMAYWCWGYSFPWQTRKTLVPAWSPNLVCTTFVCNALLDAHEYTDDGTYLEMVVSAADYIVDKLHWKGSGGVASLSYPTPESRTPVHNANFLGAELLCRIDRYTGDHRFGDVALLVARYSAHKQRDDGSWLYGESPNQDWIDNFHSGYNLCALRRIGEYTRSAEFESNVVAGEEFYRTRFILDDGRPRYFHDRTYPIDVHCIAQSILTLVCLRDLHPGNKELANKVFEWALQNMLSEGGYFYYRSYGVIKNRISYMRWSQAWMALAIAALIEASGAKDKSPSIGI
jgi:hypothetical protein